MANKNAKEKAEARRVERVKDIEFRIAKDQKNKSGDVVLKKSGKKLKGKALERSIMRREVAILDRKIRDAKNHQEERKALREAPRGVWDAWTKKYTVPINHDLGDFDGE